MNWICRGRDTFSIAQPLAFCIKAVFQSSGNLSASHNSVQNNLCHHHLFLYAQCSLFHVYWFSSGVTFFKFGFSFLFCLIPSCSFSPIDLVPVPHLILAIFSSHASDVSSGSQLTTTWGALRASNPQPEPRPICSDFPGWCPALVHFQPPTLVSVWSQHAANIEKYSDSRPFLHQLPPGCSLAGLLHVHVHVYVCFNGNVCFNWNIIDVQCCVSLKCTTHWFDTFTYHNMIVYRIISFLWWE